MSALSQFTKKNNTTTTTNTSGFDITSKQGLQQYANQLGLGKEVEKIIKKEDKIGFLSRLVTGLSSFETGNATYQSMVNNKNWFKTYFSDVGKGLYEAFTGNDITPEVKKTFKDVLTDEYRMKDRVGKIDVVDVLGLASDIVLDPTTYIPTGAIKKGVKKVGGLGESLIKTTDIGTGVYNKIEKSIAELTSTLPQFKLYDKKMQGNFTEQIINRFRWNKAAKDGLLIDTALEYKKLYKTLLKNSKTKQEAIDKLTKLGGDVGYYTEKGMNLNPLFKQYGLSDEQSSIYNYIAGVAKENEEQLLKTGVIKEAIPNRMARILTPEGRSFIQIDKSGEFQHLIKGVNRYNPVESGGIMKIVSARDVMSYTGKKNIGELSVKDIDGLLDIDDAGSIVNFNSRKDLHYINRQKITGQIEKKAAKRMGQIDKEYNKALELLTADDTSIKALKATKKQLQEKWSLKKTIKETGGEVEGIIPEITDEGLVTALEQSYKNDIISKLQNQIDNLTEKGVAKTAKTRTTKASTKWIKDRAEVLLKESTDKNLKKNLPKYKKIAREEFEKLQARSNIESLYKSKIQIQNSVTDKLNQLYKYNMIDDSGNLYKASRGTVREINNYTAKKYNGMRLFEEDYFKAMTSSNINSINRLDQFNYLNSMKESVGVKPDGMTNFFGSDLYTAKDGAQYINLGKRFPELKDVVVPVEIKDDILEAADVFFGRNGKSVGDVMDIYDKVLRAFKSSVTGIFPAFHTRNFVSGVFNNYIAGVQNPLRYDEARKIFFTKETGEILLRNGKKMTYDEIREQANRFLISSSEGMMDASRKLDPFKVTKDKTAKEFITTVGDTTQKAMTAVETELRGTLFIDRLIKGDSITDAVKKVYKYHFDYEPWGLSKIENSFMKRVIPFFTFMRNNIPLQIEEIISQPGKYAGIMKTSRALQGDITQQDKDNMTQYMQNQFLLKSGDNIISGLGTPIEEAMDQLQSPLHAIFGAMSPILKIPFEQFTGYSFFKQMDIKDDIYGKKYRNAPKVLKDFLDFTDKENADGSHFYTVDPMKKYWVDTLGLRGMSTGLSIINAIDVNDSVSKNALSVFQELITTINTSDLTIEDLTKYADEDAIKKLEDYLMRKGGISEFNKTYIPEAQREQLGVTSTGSIPKR